MPPKKTPDKKEDVKNTKIRESLLYKAKAIAAIRRIDLFDYLDEIIAPRIESDYKKMVREDHGS